MFRWRKRKGKRNRLLCTLDSWKLASGPFHVISCYFFHRNWHAKWAPIGQKSTLRVRKSFIILVRSCISIWEVWLFPKQAIWCCHLHVKVFFCLILLLPVDLFHTKTHDHEQWCHRYKERTCSERPFRSSLYTSGAPKGVNDRQRFLLWEANCHL